jgi:purine nucleoside phosphorylase
VEAEERSRAEERALAQAEIGIIGGSGLYSMPGFTNIHEERVANRRTRLSWAN